jgi:hypothetical protein
MTSSKTIYEKDQLIISSWNSKQSQLKPSFRKPNSHKANATELIIKAAFDHFDLSLNRAKAATTNITGVPNTIRIPPRSPSSEPQPKP